VMILICLICLWVWCYSCYVTLLSGTGS
jgi:hypothetical protein